MPQYAVSGDFLDDIRVRRLPDGYHLKVWPIHSVTEPDTFYWKVYFQGESINGGIADTYYQALERAVHYRFMDLTERFRWDRNSRGWVKRK